MVWGDVAVVPADDLVGKVVHVSDAQYPFTQEQSRWEGLQTAFCYKKVIYNIGTEILMLKRNLHNSTLRGRTEKSLSVPGSKFRALYDQVGPRAVAATQKQKTKIWFCIIKVIKKMILAAGGIIS